MIRAVFFLLALSALSGCLCIPEGEESTMNTSYFGSCWDEAKTGPRNQVLFPKP